MRYSKIYNDLSHRMSDLQVEVLPVSDLSLKKSRALKEARPLLVYMFISVQQPCLGWIGTSIRPSASRLRDQRSLRNSYDFVVFIQMPVKIEDDCKFCEVVEYTGINFVDTMWPWCFLENKNRREPDACSFDPLVQHIVMLLLDVVDALVPGDIRFQELNPMFDAPTHTIFDETGERVGWLVENERGLLIRRDSEIHMEPLHWHSRLVSVPKPEINAVYRRLLKQHVLYMAGLKIGQHPLLVRFPYPVKSTAEACRFLAGNSEARLSVVRR